MGRKNTCLKHFYIETRHHFVAVDQSLIILKNSQIYNLRHLGIENVQLFFQQAMYLFNTTDIMGCSNTLRDIKICTTYNNTKRTIQYSYKL